MSHSAYSLILASGSAARKSMLENAGLTFEIHKSTIDESAYQANDANALALLLAQKKACDISHKFPSSLVIGSDQTLEFEEEIFSKAISLEDGKAKLKRLQGKTHSLYSSVCVAQEGQVLWSHQARADLTMHEFDDDFFNAYCARETDALCSCVGGYKIEGAGAWLFSNVQGDVYTIMGMPLLPLLAYLRQMHGVGL